ncbi:C40 family peptidase [Nocardioides panacisoli]|uniref:C40 family peptidase n=1 Tax=Nocardioides panacisoli TaxID=627624 RepID=UPI001C6372A6|nr:C40 family peptidase [Nocardioides panacisoli]QYJ04710.1 C40 family peptidase [Nocardioides panacisoli]
MLTGRQRAFAALLAGVLALLIGLIPFGPATAEPDIEDVRAKVDKLYREAEEASERHNDAKIELEELQAELDSVSADEERQSAQLGDARGDVRDSIIRQHQGQTLGGAGKLLESDSDGFMSELSTVATVNQLQDALLEKYNNELDAFAIRSDQVTKRRERVAELEEKLASEMETAEGKHEEAKELLDELEAEQRAEVVSRDAQVTPTADLPPASGSAQAAVNYARAQVGKTYVYGAMGPNAFDCSGLTMRAWGAAGVGLPHSSGAQMGSGRSVPFSQLQPGDLVFYYSPVSHVGIYVGNGMIVHAANPSTGVAMAPVRSMPYSGAVRPG